MKVKKGNIGYIILIGMVSLCGLYLYMKDQELKSIHLSNKKVSVSSSNNEWTTEPIYIRVNYAGPREHIKQYSYDGGKTWTKSSSLLVDKNTHLDIAVKDINDNVFFLEHDVMNIDVDGPIILADDPIYVARGAKVNLNDYIIADDSASGIKTLNIEPMDINTTVNSSYSVKIIAIDNLENRTIKDIRVHVVDKVPNILVKVITLDQTNLNLKVGDEEVLGVNIAPKTATNQQVTWTSSNPEVATVDIGGKIVGVSPGSATITATTSNGIKANCIIIVK